MQTLSRDHPSLVKSRQAPESYPSCSHHDLAFSSRTHQAH